MSSGQQAPTTPVEEAMSPSSSAVTGGIVSSETTPPMPKSVTNAANQILFKNELYTSMKQKTIDQEVITRLTQEAREKEKQKMKKAELAMARLDNKLKILIGVGDMIGPPGCDPSPISSASIAVTASRKDTIREVKKKLIAAALWKDESPNDFGLFNDYSEEPLKDSTLVESVLALDKPASAERVVGKRTWNKQDAAGSIRLPRPYVLVLWAARMG